MTIAMHGNNQSIPLYIYIKPYRLLFFYSSTRNNSRHLSTSLEESVQLIKSEVIPCLQNAMQTLQNIWSEIGLPEDQKEERTQSVLLHLRNLLNQMVNEEEELKATLQANVESCSQELEKLCQELGLPVYKVHVIHMRAESRHKLIKQTDTHS